MSELSPSNSHDTFAGELRDLTLRFDSLKPELELTVRDPGLRVEGYVVVWNTGVSVNGPLARSGKGGTRITPSTSLDEIRMLAKIMALKNAAAGLPLGGAKSGMRDDPDSADFETRYRRFAQLVKPVLYEHGGVFGGLGLDIGARPEHPRWACEEFGSTRSFTGKPFAMGGTDYDEEGLAGLGVALAARAALEKYGQSMQGATFAVQGGGAMGAAVIRYFTEFGAELRNISGPICGGTYVFEKGLSSELLQSLIARTHPRSIDLLNLGGYKRLPLEDVLYEPVDVLFPCAVQDVITEQNAHRIRAKFVVEGANNPCTEQARRILHQRGVTVIPDFIANPGGIIAAFVEMTSSVTIEENIRTKRKVQEAKALIEEKIPKNVTQILELAAAHGVEPFQAGLYIALRNIFGER